jgi:hypothetical protein
MPATRRQGRRLRWWLGVTGSAEINPQERAVRAIAGMARSYQSSAEKAAARVCGGPVHGEVRS